MKLLMVSGDRTLTQGKKSAFWFTLEEFHRHWDRIDILCPMSGSQTPNPVHSNVFLHPSPWGLWRQPWWILRKGKELVAEHRHDVMTVHEYPPFYNGLGARRLHHATGIPYALEIHHIVGYPRAASVGEWIGRAMSRWCLRWNARSAAAVRVVNEEVKEVLAQWGIPAEKIRVVHSAYLDHELFAGSDSAEKNWDVAFCARLVANKGLMEVIEAVEKIPEATLLVIGEGPLRAKAEGRVRSLGMADRVKFLGWLPEQRDVIAAIRSARVFVMNSSSEGGPRSALEAMAAGVPVITTKVGLMPEMIRDNVNGVFTDGSAEDLREKIRNLLRHESLRSEIGKEAAKILTQFDRRALISAYADFLKQLV